AQGPARDSAAVVKARVSGWEIADSGTGAPNVLESEGPVAVRFFLDVSKDLHVREHGISLSDSDGRLIWGWATRDLKLREGRVELRYAFPSLPIRPGIYYWRISLYDETELVDDWVCVPEMVIATQNHQHYLDQWNGILNMPCSLSIEGSNS